MAKLKHILIYVRYLLFRYLKNRYFSNYKIYNKNHLIPVSNDKESFFGYYNISPENREGKILYCIPTNNNSLKILYQYKGANDTIDTTDSWNWQQGCMLQWGQANSNIVYYNKYNYCKKQYEAISYNIELNKIEMIYDIPLYSIAKDEEYALSLNFERLAIMRPDYGYFCKSTNKLPNNSQDGIWKINLRDNTIKLIITIDQLANLNPSESMIDADHKVNHIDISPDGKRFMFLHRWIGEKGRYTRLITANSDGTNLYILNGDKMTSHSCWWGNDRIISFCYTQSFGNSYVIFKDKTDSVSLISKKLPHEDGHPIISKDGKYLIIDTYPNLDRMSFLYKYNIEENNLEKIGRFYQPLKYLGTNRIDLHPKFNCENDYIYFESGHTGSRKLFKLKV